MVSTLAVNTYEERKFLDFISKAETSLAEANTTMERWELRDEFQRASVAAAAAGLPRIAALASVMVLRAERLELKHNQPKESGYHGHQSSVAQDDTTPESIPVIKPSTLRNMRADHAGVDDQEFEERAAAAISNEEVLTRKDLKEMGKDKKRKERDEQRQAYADQAIAEHAFCDTLPVYNCAIADLRQYVEQGSVDAIITDPPYPKEFIGVVRELAEFAVHALKPGGSLVALLGQLYIPQWIEALTIDGLDYRWLGHYLCEGVTNTVYPSQIWSEGKTLLMYTRSGPQFPNAGFAQDLYRSPGGDAKKDKEIYEWAQSTAAFQEIVKNFSRPGEVVCDPFAGVGTTLIAAQREGRLFIGGEMDAGRAAITRKRLEEERNG